MIRLGLHRMSGRADHLFRDYVARVRPNVVKFLDPGPDDEPLAAWCRSLGVEVIGRRYFQDQPLGASGGRNIAKVLDDARACPSIVLWQFYNECHQSGEDLARYAELSIEFMERLEALGGIRRAVIGCFSVGNPDLPEGDRGREWRNFAPALEHAAARGHFLGLNQYGGGSLGIPFEADWHVLRHRQVIAWAKSAGVRMPRILLTESGIDVINRADRPTRGWQTMGSDYHYEGELAWLCRELGKDPLVAGVVDFGFAHVDPQWKDFDLAERPDMLAAVAAAQMAIQAPAPPKPKEETMDLYAMLREEFGARFQDLRPTLPTNPNGPFGDFDRRALELIDILAVHHTVSGKDMTWDAIARDHIKNRKFAGAGYHIGIRRGVVSILGDLDQARACCEDQNHRVLCVSMTGNYEVDVVDAGDEDALRRVVATVQRWAAGRLRRRLQVLGHGDVPGQSTACPGANLKPLVRKLNAAASPPAPTVDRAALVTAAKAAQVLRPNPKAALQKRLLADGFVPTSNEFRQDGLAAQLAERLSDGAVRVYYCPVGKWDAVKYLEIP